MNEKILKLLNKDARMTVTDIAAATGLSDDEVRADIREMEEAGILRGYKALIDWEKTGKAYVSAIIELKVTPKEGQGFEEIAARVARYPEVEAVYLMSGTYDLSVIVKRRTFQEVALFVARELSTLESVVSTATHFVLRRYKELDVTLATEAPDERGAVSV